mmetsp:Transcript_13830/g.27992  ORF Transcript_13830/g.27992 Transcript_13830/m.27992 type:complete len:227 (-) Transcript_13830:159-839(-)
MDIPNCCSFSCSSRQARRCCCRLMGWHLLSSSLFHSNQHLVNSSLELRLGCPVVKAGVDRRVRSSHSLDVLGFSSVAHLEETLLQCRATLPLLGRGRHFRECLNEGGHPPIWPWLEEGLGGCGKVLGFHFFAYFEQLAYSLDNVVLGHFSLVLRKITVVLLRRAKYAYCLLDGFLDEIEPAVSPWIARRGRAHPNARRSPHRCGEVRRPPHCNLEVPAGQKYVGGG